MIHTKVKKSLNFEKLFLKQIRKSFYKLKSLLLISNLMTFTLLEKRNGTQVNELLMQK